MSLSPLCPAGLPGRRKDARSFGGLVCARLQSVTSTVILSADDTSASEVVVRSRALLKEDARCRVMFGSRVIIGGGLIRV